MPDPTSPGPSDAAVTEPPDLIAQITELLPAGWSFWELTVFKNPDEADAGTRDTAAFARVRLANVIDMQGNVPEVSARGSTPDDALAGLVGLLREVRSNLGDRLVPGLDASVEGQRHSTYVIGAAGSDSALLALDEALVGALGTDGVQITVRRWDTKADENTLAESIHNLMDLADDVEKGIAPNEAIGWMWPEFVLDIRNVVAAARPSDMTEFDGSVCPACHHRAHDPGSCPECPRCELHTDEALAFVLRHETAVLPALTAAAQAVIQVEDDWHKWPDQEYFERRTRAVGALRVAVAIEAAARDNARRLPDGPVQVRLDPSPDPEQKKEDPDADD